MKKKNDITEKAEATCDLMATCHTVAAEVNKAHGWIEGRSGSFVTPEAVLKTINMDATASHPITQEIVATLNRIAPDIKPQKVNTPTPTAIPKKATYIDLAHNTSAPVEPIQARLKGNFMLIALLRRFSADFCEAAENMDALKRAIFYENIFPEFGIGMTKISNANIALQNPQVVELLHAAIGFATEAGEFLQAVNNHIFEGLPLDTTNLREEIGDNQWYAAKACKFTGTTLEIEQSRNIAKLATRFPNKFTNADALVRNLEQERAVLEKELTQQG